MIIETVRTVLLDDMAVSAAFDTRGYPVQLPDAPTYPAFVLTKVTGPEEYVFAGKVGIERARVQIDVYSDTGYADLVTLKDLIKRRLSGFTGGPASSPESCAIQECRCITDSDFPVPDTERAGPRLRRRLLEFIVWNTEV